MLKVFVFRYFYFTCPENLISGKYNSSMVELHWKFTEDICDHLLFVSELLYEVLPS